MIPETDNVSSVVTVTVTLAILVGFVLKWVLS